MDKDGVFWFRVMALAATTTVSIVFLVVVAGINNNQTIANLVKDGASPMTAMCAVSGSSQNTQCTVIASKQEK